MSKEEMAFEIANRYLHGGNAERKAILSAFDEDEQDIFLNFIGYYKLFNDQKYYNAVMHAVREQIVGELYEGRD